MGDKLFIGTHISALTFPRLLNLKPNLSFDIGLSCPCAYTSYLIFIFINIYENIKNIIHEWGYTYKINTISSVLAIDY